MGALGRECAGEIREACCILDRLGEIKGTPAAFTQHAQRHDLGLPGDTGNAEAIVRYSPDRPRHVGPVVAVYAGTVRVIPSIGGIRISATAIPCNRGIADEVIARNDTCLKIRVTDDPCIDDSHNDRVTAGCQIPGLFERNLIVVPLGGMEAIVWDAPRFQAVITMGIFHLRVEAKPANRM